MPMPRCTHGSRHTCCELCDRVQRTSSLLHTWTASARAAARVSALELPMAWPTNFMRSPGGSPFLHTASVSSRLHSHGYLHHLSGLLVPCAGHLPVPHV